MSQLTELTRINLNDTFDSLGVGHWRGAARTGLEWLLQPAARQFAEQVAHFDRLVGERGLPVGADWIIRYFIHTLEVAGQAHIPSSGPLLALSNHPGMADTVALFIAMRRPDLRIMALERPFLRALPHTSAQLIYVTDEAADRMSAVRAVLENLRAGHAVLTFPAGRIEPDPAVLPGAADALEQWSESATLFARRLPHLPIVPTLVSGVLSPAAHRNPLLRLRRAQTDREKMAAMLQILIPAYRGVRARVAFGAPLLLAAHSSPNALHQAVLNTMRDLIAQPPTAWETVVKGHY